MVCSYYLNLTGGTSGRYEQGQWTARALQQCAFSQHGHLSKASTKRFTGVASFLLLSAVIAGRPAAVAALYLPLWLP